MKKYFSIIPFVTLSLVASFINYITYPILARQLPDLQFVDVAVALSLLTQISAFLASVAALAIAYTKHDQEQSPVKTLEILQASLIRSFMFLVVIFIIILPLIVSQIHIAPMLAIPIIMLMILSIPVSVISGYLGGRQRMVQFGLVAVITSIAQFVFAIATAYITGNGTLTLIFMAVGQLIGVVLLYIIFKDEGLPRVSTIFAKHEKLQRSKITRYALLASLGVMIINVLQILDLLIIKSFRVDQRLYTDISIVSRLVFFSGMIFIWPFLGSIDVKNQKNNIPPITKLLALFLLIGSTAIIGLSIFGEKIIRLLTASDYSISVIRDIGIPAIIFKILFLVMTFLVLYFIVLKSRFAIIYPLIVLMLFATISGITISSASSTQSTVVILDIISGVSVIIGLVLMLGTIIKSKTPPLTKKF